MSDYELKERRIAESRSRLSPAQLALLEKRLKGASAAPAATATIAPRKAGLPVELSFAQQRMWFLNQLEPDNPFYNISIAVEIKGVLCVGTLERAANEIVRRHEALRTSFQTIDRRPMQVIAPELHVEAPLIDLRDIQPRERRQETQRLINEEAKSIFNLSASPLMRLCLLRLNDAEHVISLVLHHIVSDGWSMGLFVRE